MSNTRIWMVRFILSAIGGLSHLGGWSIWVVFVWIVSLGGFCYEYIFPNLDRGPKGPATRHQESGVSVMYQVFGIRYHVSGIKYQVPCLYCGICTCWCQSLFPSLHQRCSSPSQRLITGTVWVLLKSWRVRRRSPKDQYFDIECPSDEELRSFLY